MYDPCNCMWRILLLLIWSLCCFSSATSTENSRSTEIPSALLPLEARNTDVSSEDDVISTSYVLPNQIFNDGKPYYARQDPVSGQLDFSAKKPAGIEPEANEVLNSKEKIVLSGGAPNIHDYLNLPVKYSSSKFVYPLVSSSYANLKYQGSNKNYITNKKPTSVVAPVTPTPNYHNSNYYTVPTTKLTAVQPTFHTTTTTTRKTSTSSKKSTATSAPTTSTSTTKYTTTTRRPVITTYAPLPPRTSTTRKKFVPTRKLSPTVSSDVNNTTLVNLRDQRPQNSTSTPRTTQQPRPTQTSTSERPFTTRHPTPQAPIFPTEPTTTAKMYTTSTSTTVHSPIVFTENPTVPPAFSPIPISTRIPNLDPADVYHTLGQKNTHTQKKQPDPKATLKPPMTLGDIFNSLAEEESAVAHNYQQNQGFDAQGNLIEPIVPSKPSPFIMQTLQRPTVDPLHPQYATTSTISINQPNIPQHPHSNNEQKLISASQENYSNEYVSFQVQQPNVMQYRPLPGQINNVVISPGQQSASFVLGSQQQVGQSSHASSIEKQTLFPKDLPSVQYGQVINEDIVNIKRPMLPNYSAASAPSTNYEQMPTIQLNSNFHQTGNAVAVGSTTPAVSSGLGGYQLSPPEAPTTFQQLPLIGSNLRPPKPPTLVKSEVPLQQSPSSYQLSQTLTPVQTTSSQSALNSQDTKELLVSTNIRFPANDEESFELASSLVGPSPPTGAQINGHAQPLSLQQIQNGNPVVFPKPKHEQSNSNVQIEQHDVLTMNQHKQQLNSNQQPSRKDYLSQLPSQNMEPPPRYHNNQHGTLSQPMSNNHLNTQSSQPYPAYKEFNRKPQPGNNGRPTTNLPNILPQFRPNAKVSSGHTPSLKQESGTIRLPPHAPKRPYNPAPPPQFAHRRQPLQQQYQKRYPINRISEYSVNQPAAVIDMNRRIFRLSSHNGQNTQHLPDKTNIYTRRPGAQLPALDGYTVERHAPITGEHYKVMNAESMSDFEEEDLVINDPPQPVASNKEHQNISEAKLEPVVTLQMLQSQKKAVGLPTDDTGAGEIQVTEDNNPQDTDTSQDETDPNRPHVVFPSKTKEKRSESEIKDNKESVIQSETLSGSEYQNTPFSVVREQPQEPILKNKKPQSLQQAKVQQINLSKEKFPYPIEKPDLFLTGSPKVPGILIAPRIVNSAFGSGTEAPIAIAYTPTEPNIYSRTVAEQEKKFSNINLAASVINEIRVDSQTEEAITSDFDLRGQNYEKDFMAPFYPSISLNGAKNVPSSKLSVNSWNIVPSSTDRGIFVKNNINRADILSTDAESAELDNGDSATDITTEQYFEKNSFQPELQGGFKPIYPPGYKLAEQDEEQEKIASKEMKNQPLALALVGQKSTSALTENNTTLSTTTTHSPTTKIVSETSTSSEATISKATVVDNAESSTQKKTMSFETSLAALLFGDEREDAARKSIPKAKVGPRNVPRMGPRSLS